MSKTLPVLNFAPFRKYPTKLAVQDFADEREVCQHCLSGACCTSEDPIYLTSFDVFRLSAFFDISPAEFLLRFTQERFDAEDSAVLRRPWIDDPESSKITYLRRRGNVPHSACIFLKYIREPDGTPRRICSVHDARPLSCREFYFNHCKQRVTGELAALLAEGFEKVRDGELTAEAVDAALAQFENHDYGTAPAADSVTYSFWLEMKRVLNMEQANVEGAQGYDVADYQDPIDEKLNRVLSAKYLRFEEDYGPKPCAEQLMPYTSGRRFAGSSEHARIMALLRARPSSGLHSVSDYPFYFGLRTMLPGVKHAEVFPIIPEKAASEFLASIPPTQLFPNHDLSEVRALTQRDVYAATLKGFNHLIRFAGYLAVQGDVLEGAAHGLIELELLEVLASFETSLNPFIAQNPYFQPVKCYLASVAIGLLEQKLAAAVAPAETFGVYQSLCMTESVVPILPTELQARYESLARTVQRNLQKNRLELYVQSDDPVATRRLAGKRLSVRRAWAELRRQLLDMRYAANAGFDGVNLPAFYQRAVENLEQIAFRRSYSSDLARAVVNLARSMSFDGRVAFAHMPYQDAASRLANYGSRLFNWLDNTWGCENLDLEILAGFSAYVYKGLGRSYNCDHNFGRIVQRLLMSQLPDGSWLTNPLPDETDWDQADYLHVLYRATGAGINGLRVLRADILNLENAPRGLV
jgi:Fe-S-cluster containining protein